MFVVGVVIRLRIRQDEVRVWWYLIKMLREMTSMTSIIILVKTIGLDGIHCMLCYARLLLENVDAYALSTAWLCCFVLLLLTWVYIHLSICLTGGPYGERKRRLPHQDSPPAD